MDAHYRIRNWTTFQHYKHRSPPWIKFHRTLLDDEKFHRFPDRASKLLVLAWLLASEAEGALPASHEIAWRLRLASTEVLEDMKTLVALGFVEPASGVLAECVQDASDLLYQSRVETEAETEKEKNPAGSKRKTALSDGWTPTDAHREQATGLGVDLGRCVEDFRDHAKGTGRLMKDWDATFRTWLRKAPEFAGNGRKDQEQVVADILLMVSEKAGDLQFLPRPQVLKAIEADYPVHWSRSGRYMEQMKLGTISGMAAKDREHEVRIQVRQLNGVV